MGSIRTPTFMWRCVPDLRADPATQPMLEELHCYSLEMASLGSHVDRLHCASALMTQRSTVMERRTKVSVSTSYGLLKELLAAYTRFTS